MTQELNHTGTARLLHLSDTHFGAERTEVMAALLALDRRLCPDVAVLSGDVTQRARPREFAAARAWVKALSSANKLVLPGNHDLPLFNLWARWRAPYAGFEEAFGRHGSGGTVVVDTPRWLVIGVDTTRPHRHKDGEVAPSQIDAVVRHLDRARPQQLRVVVTHQPMAVITAADRPNLLHGHLQASRAWALAGADLLLGGHIHLPYAVPLALPSRAHARALAEAPWVVQAGTAISRRVRGGGANSVNVIDWDPAAAADRCRLTQYDYRAEEAAFVAVRQVVLR